MNAREAWEMYLLAEDALRSMMDGKELGRWRKKNLKAMEKAYGLRGEARKRRKRGNEQRR